jgi:putative thioredoxin
MDGSTHVFDASLASFEQDVILASKQVPVLVDFWATWCGPCKTLGPVLEKAVQEAKGAVRLVKIDVDKNPAVAGQLRIQSIPAVYAFFQGRPVDGFMGAQPESQVKQFVQRLAKQAGAAAGPSPVDEALEQAEATLKEGDAATASAIFGEVLQHEPENLPAIGGLVRCLVKTGELPEARAQLAKVPANQANDQAIAAARAALELAEQAGEKQGGLDEIKAKLAKDPNDHQSRYDLAMAHYGNGETEPALDELLELFRRNRGWNEEAARKQLVKIFEALGPTDPLTLSARRRLSSLMFA